MKDTRKLFVYLASFYLYGSIVGLLGLQELFSGNISALPILLVVAGVTIALAPGFRLQTRSPRERLPSDRLAVVLGSSAVGIVVLASVILTIG